MRNVLAIGIVISVLFVSGCSGGGGSSVLPNVSSATSTSTQTSALSKGAPTVALLRAFRPIGGSGSSVPGSAELTIAPLNFAADAPAGTPLSGPNPRTISNIIAGGTGSQGQNGESNDATLSAWLYVFGQFVDHDLGLESTPPSAAPINITIPAGDPFFPSGSIIAMTRVMTNPATRTIVNTTAGFLDLSQLYGSDSGTAASLSNPDGTLKSSGNGQFLNIVGGAFITGDPRVMENPELTAVTTLFMREHNYWVATLRAQHPTWTGSVIYDMAKAITTAEYQNIVYAQYLPHLIGPVLPGYAGYRGGTNAQMTQEFTTAAFRVGHTQISDTQEGLSGSGAVVFTEPLAQSFFNTPAMDEANGIDPILASLGADYAQTTDPFVVPTLRNALFSPLPGGDVDKTDLIAIDIQRERDAGIATLNEERHALGMPPYTSFAQLTSDPATQQLYAQTYGSIDQVDLFMGGLAENHAPGAAVGPTFQAIIVDQFRRLRDGDQFFWQNQGFDPQTASMIASTTLTSLMTRDTSIAAAFQQDLFVQGTFMSRTK